MVKAEDQEGKPVWDKPIDVDEKWIQFVDANVSASELFKMSRRRTRVANGHRSTSRLQGQRHCTIWSQLLDTYSRDSNRTSRRFGVILLS